MAIGEHRHVVAEAEPGADLLLPDTVATGHQLLGQVIGVLGATVAGARICAPSSLPPSASICAN
ncbi:MAG: hypothetical protein J5I81_10035 [Nitrococcus mobilis]|nr:hypothetical protein [Nitrococcus mobilis]